MMWSETEGEWRRIQFRTMESPAQEVAGALGLRIATRPGAKVEKIIEIEWMDERKDGPNGADIGGPDVQELWVMDSFAFALSDGIWVRPSVANTQSHTHVPSYVPSYRSISDIISAQALNMIKIHQYTLPPLARVSSAISSLPRH